VLAAWALGQKIEKWASCPEGNNNGKDLAHQVSPLLFVREEKNTVISLKHYLVRLI
jgi:hypothetical protein